MTPPSEAVVPLKLVVVSGPDFGRSLSLERGTYRVGKAADCDLALADGAVSSTHLLIEVLKGRARFTDAGSRNGSFVGDVAFKTVELRAPAHLRIGRTELKLVTRAETAPALAPSLSDRFGGLRGKSLAMRSLFATLERAARGDADLLILGETGTGKDVCARAIHEASPRARAPFVTVDLAATTPELIGSELFGHQKGAFTGAETARRGAFERAEGGTVLLEEVGELSLELQPWLLRVLERREVKPLGADAHRPVDVRVLAATHHPLRKRVEQGTFRADLYHRLAAVTLTLPPLRERMEDLPLLIDSLLADLKPGANTALDPATLALLRDYRWPGNVRELKNVVERAVSLGGAVDVPLDDREPPPRPREAGDVNALPFKRAKDRLVAAFEKDYLVQLLARCGGNVSRAAKEAGIARVYLQRLMKKHALREA
ncbi:MAG: sigma 54-dependent Fis family transcriptional regulator [Archangiaceae bacterium]|nr:sigma 54-dependent Fis family transcriptional regulator [Archangiaceae bacterium]